MVTATLMLKCIRGRSKFGAHACCPAIPRSIRHSGHSHKAAVCCRCGSGASGCEWMAPSWASTRSRRACCQRGSAAVRASAHIHADASQQYPIPASSSFLKRCLCSSGLSNKARGSHLITPAHQTPCFLAARPGLFCKGVGICQPAISDTVMISMRGNPIMQSIPNTLLCSIVICCLMAVCS